MEANRTRIGLPSPALVVAVLALLAAFAGSALAKHHASLSGKAKKQVRKIAASEAAGALAARLPLDASGIGDNAVNSAKVADDSLTGADVDESSFGKVPTADHLDGLDSSDVQRTKADAISNAAGGSLDSEDASLSTSDHSGFLDVRCYPTNPDVVYRNNTTANQDAWIDTGPGTTHDELGPYDFTDSVPIAGDGRVTYTVVSADRLAFFDVHVSLIGPGECAYAVRSTDYAI